MGYFLVQLREGIKDSRDRGFKRADQTVEEENKCSLKRDKCAHQSGRLNKNRAIW